MFHQPLFWFFLLCQFLIFIFLVNRVSFHPLRVVPEAMWVISWTILLFALDLALILGLAHVWDFTVDTFPELAFSWKVFRRRFWFCGCF